MQFKVPQNVEREDQIIGPVTMKQLIICTVGGGLAYSIYVFLAKRYTMEIWLPPTAVVALLTLAVAFVKINDIPFLKWVMLLIEYFLTANKRVWTKGADQIRIVDLPKKKPAETEKKNTKNHSRDDIRRLVKALDSADYSHLAESQMKEIEAEKNEKEHAEKLSKIIAQPPKITKKAEVKPEPEKITLTPTPEKKPEIKTEKPTPTAKPEPEKITPTPPPKPKIPMKVIVAKSAQKKNPTAKPEPEKKPIISPQFQNIKTSSNPQNKMPNTKPTFTEKAKTMAKKTQETLTTAKDKTVETAKVVQEKAKKAEVIVDKTKEGYEKAKSGLTEVSTKTKEGFAKAKEAVTNTTEQTKTWFGNVKDKTKEVIQKVEPKPKNEIHATELQKGGEIKF